MVFDNPQLTNNVVGDTLGVFTGPEVIGEDVGSRTGSRVG